MAKSVRQTKKQTKLFAQRTFDKQKNADLITKNTEKLIDQAIKEGKTVNELKTIFAKEARKAVNYARTIARTDATRIENEARHDAYVQISNLGVMLGKVWKTSKDSKVRDSHGVIDDEEQFYDDLFSIGGMYPADPNLPAHERYGCRCRTLPIVLETEGLTDDERRVYNEKIRELNDRVLKELMEFTYAEDGGIVNLITNEQSAINKYISSEAYTLNEKLRNNSKLDYFEKVTVDDLDTALKKMPKYEGDVSRSVLLYDEQLDKFLQEHAEGETVLYKSYTSFTKGDTYNDNANIEIHITSSNGRDISSINSAEQEILYERNAKFDVVEIDEIEGIHHIVLKEI